MRVFKVSRRKCSGVKDGAMGMSVCETEKEWGRGERGEKGGERRAGGFTVDTELKWTSRKLKDKGR